MHNFFNLVSSGSSGIQRFQDWQYCRDGLKKNLGNVIRFYRQNPMAVKSDHLLVSLLQSITIPQSQNLERYYDNVDSLSLNLSMAFKLTSAIYKGRLFNGIFYGSGNDEILIANNDGFDIVEANRNWKNVCAVKVLRHSLSDLGLNIPDGNNTGSETGIAVISINIPMLAVQYRAFRNNEILIAEQTMDSQRSIMQFIHMFVLPNMLFSHLDQAIFNRINNLQKGAPLGESKKSHSFYLPDYSKKMNQTQEFILDYFNNTSKDFTSVLKTVPAVTKNDMEEVMLMEDIAPTRQVAWALTVSRLPALSFLFKVSIAGRNQSTVNQVLKSVMAYKSENTMRTMLPHDIYMDVQDDIDSIVRDA